MTYATCLTRESILLSNLVQPSLKRLDKWNEYSCIRIHSYAFAATLLNLTDYGVLVVHPFAQALFRGLILMFRTASLTFPVIESDSASDRLTFGL